MYNLQLDGRTVLQRLKESKTNGTLQADIAPEIMLEKLSAKGAGKVKITIQSGEVVACDLYTVRGVLQQKEQILGLLDRVGALPWQLLLSSEVEHTSTGETSRTTAPLRRSEETHTPSIELLKEMSYNQNTSPLPTISGVPYNIPPPQSEKLFPSFAFVPYRLHVIPLASFRDQTSRKVYQLIDGQRTIERIAMLAHILPQNATIIIQRLHAEGIVDIKD